MDKWSVGNSSSKLKKRKGNPLKFSQVTLHMEATEYFENRLLSISYTENNGWNVKDITESSPNEDLQTTINADKQELDKTNRNKFKINSKDSKIHQLEKMKSDQPTVALTRILKLEENPILNRQEVTMKQGILESPESEKKKIKKGKEFQLMYNLLFRSKWSEIAPNCYISVIGRSGNKQYKCTKCDHTSHKTMRAAEHFYVNHDPAKSFSCAYCEVDFPTRSKLKKHLSYECYEISQTDRTYFVQTNRDKRR